MTFEPVASKLVLGDSSAGVRAEDGLVEVPNHGLDTEASQVARGLGAFPAYLLRRRAQRNARGDVHVVCDPGCFGSVPVLSLSCDCVSRTFFFARGKRTRPSSAT